MAKPQTLQGYDDLVTRSCERVLVTLLSGLGPWRESIFLIGGLTPRYLIGALPPGAQEHAGTGDVDIVVQLHMLSQTEAYHSLEDNFKRLGFERAKGKDGAPVSWRWGVDAGDGITVVVELLADDPALTKGGQVTELPTDGNLSAMNIPHSGMVFDHHRVTKIRAELLGSNGIAEVDLRHADIVAFTCLKALAFDHRVERKDAHDLIHCFTHYEGAPESIAEALAQALTGKHAETVKKTLDLLAQHFVDDEATEGYLKTGPVAVAKFELGEDPAASEDRALRQRDVADLVRRVLSERH